MHNSAIRKHYRPYLSPYWVMWPRSHVEDMWLYWSL